MAKIADKKKKKFKADKDGFVKLADSDEFQTFCALQDSDTKVLVVFYEDNTDKANPILARFKKNLEGILLYVFYAIYIIDA